MWSNSGLTERHLKDRVRKRRAYSERRAWLYEQKSKPCQDCGVQYSPWIMDFDHRDAETKSFNISSAVGEKRPIVRLSEEIKKCDLVCANCHRERTHRRKI